MIMLFAKIIYQNCNFLIQKIRIYMKASWYSKLQSIPLSCEKHGGDGKSEIVNYLH